MNVALKAFSLSFNLKENQVSNPSKAFREKKEKLYSSKRMKKVSIQDHTITNHKCGYVAMLFQNESYYIHERH